MDAKTALLKLNNLYELGDLDTPKNIKTFKDIIKTIMGYSKEYKKIAIWDIDNPYIEVDKTSHFYYDINITDISGTTFKFVSCSFSDKSIKNALFELILHTEADKLFRIGVIEVSSTVALNKAYTMKEMDILSTYKVGDSYFILYRKLDKIHSKTIGEKMSLSDYIDMGFSNKTYLNIASLSKRVMFTDSKVFLREYLKGNIEFINAFGNERAVLSSEKELLECIESPYFCSKNSQPMTGKSFFSANLSAVFLYYKDFCSKRVINKLYELILTKDTNLLPIFKKYAMKLGDLPPEVKLYFECSD